MTCAHPPAHLLFTPYSDLTFGASSLAAWVAAGPGMFCAMFRKLLHPLGAGRLHICGKGGEAGDTYMLEHAVSMLRAQGFTGERSRILIVGDRFDTDLKAGALAGIRTCLVESGCHSIGLQPHFPDAPASFVAASVADLIPPKRRASAWRRISFDVCSETMAPAGLRASPRALPRASPRTTAAVADSAGVVAEAAEAEAAAEEAAAIKVVAAAEVAATPAASPAAPPAAASPALPPPSVSRQPSTDASQLLRSWQLGRGNLVYSARSGAMHGSILLVLRSWFEAHTAATDDECAPTISAADALEAMRALGISPPTMDDGRPLHRFPFDVTAERSRVTYARLCRAVQRALEAAAASSRSGAAEGGPGAGRAISVFDHPTHPSARAAGSPAHRESGETSPQPFSPALRQRWRASGGGLGASSSSRGVGAVGGGGGDGGGTAEAPAVMLTRRPSGRMGGRMSGRMPTVGSENNLEMLEKRWREARPVGRHGPSSRLVRALVEQRFLVLGSSTAEI